MHLSRIILSCALEHGISLDPVISHQNSLRPYYIFSGSYYRSMILNITCARRFRCILCISQKVVFNQIYLQIY